MRGCADGWSYRPCDDAPLFHLVVAHQCNKIRKKRRPGFCRRKRAGGSSQCCVSGHKTHKSFLFGCICWVSKFLLRRAALAFSVTYLVFCWHFMALTRDPCEKIYIQTSKEEEDEKRCIPFRLLSNAHHLGVDHHWQKSLLDPSAGPDAYPVAEKLPC